MEHLNRVCKEAISGLVANITDNSIECVGRCIGRLEGILQHYVKDNEDSGSHTKHSMTVDLNKTLTQLRKSAVLTICPSRMHGNFPNFILKRKVSKPQLLQYMYDRVNKLIM